VRDHKPWERYAKASVVDVAFMSGRIPITPPFMPHQGHLHGTAPFIPVSDVFDLEFLSKMKDDIPILEMHQLKAQMNTTGSYEEPKEESLGCWSFYLNEMDHPSEWPAKDLRGISAPCQCIRLTGVDLELTPLPKEILYGGYWGKISTFGLAHLLKPKPTIPYVQPASSAERLVAINRPSPALHPEDHLSCVDLLFYTSYTGDMCWNEISSGVGNWNNVGRYMRFTPELMETSRTFLRQIFDLDSEAAIPPVSMRDHHRMCRIDMFSTCLYTYGGQMYREGLVRSALASISIEHGRSWSISRRNDSSS